MQTSASDQNDFDNILYRVNVGGATLVDPDGGLNWSADTSNLPSPYRIGSGGSRFYGTNASVNLSSPTLPVSALPPELFASQRFDPASGAEMEWSFDVTPGSTVEVRLYFAEWWGKGEIGNRVFDVAVENSVPTEFDDIDIVAISGGKKTGIMVSHTLTVEDGALDLEFLHLGSGNPFLNGIELIALEDGEPPTPPTVPTLSIVDSSVDEGAGVALFTVNLSSPSSEVIAVDYESIDGTALSGLDYSAANGTLVFEIGEITKTFAVPIIEDDEVEDDEVLTARLSNVTGTATLDDDLAVLTIQDNDSPLPPPTVPTLSIVDSSADEGAGVALFTVNLSSPSSEVVSVNYESTDGTALSGLDYSAANGTLVFEIGEITKTFAVPIIEDDEVEDDEVLTARLSNVTGTATLDDDLAVLTIQDNDSPLPPPPPVDPSDIEAFDTIVPVDAVIEGAIGAALISINANSRKIQKSSNGLESFQVKNTGDKRIAAIYFDLTDALYPDMVFDPQGLAGDSVSRGLKFRSTGSSGVYQPAYKSKDPQVVEPFFGLGGSSGYKGMLLSFDPDVQNGYNPGESISFGVDIDPNSIAGVAKVPLNIDGNDSRLFAEGQFWDHGGVSGAELINSKITVLFTDGTEAVGALSSDASQAGAVAVATQSPSDKNVSLSVNGLTEGSSGSYGSEDIQVLISGNAGDTARISLTRGFIQPFDFIDPNGDIANISANFVDSPFPANNALEFQTVDVVLNGTEQDITSLFDFDPPGDEFSFAGDDRLPLGFVATTIDAAGLPVGSVTDPIYLNHINAPNFASLVRYGTVANDTLIGTDASEAIYAYGADDILEGGRGNDFLEGGDGNDQFRLTIGFENDSILDFTPGSDVIDISDFGFAETTFNALASSGGNPGLIDEGDMASGITTSLKNGDLLINFGTGDTLTLINQSILNSGDLVF